MTDPIVIAGSMAFVALLGWDFGRRWLARQDYRSDLARSIAKVEDLRRSVEDDLDGLRHVVTANRERTDKAISNLAAQTQETLTALEKKHNAVLSGGMMRPPRPGNRI